MESGHSAMVESLIKELIIADLHGTMICLLYTSDADVDGEWTFSNGRITHQRADNSRFAWDYDKGTQGGGDDAEIGSLGPRTAIAPVQ